LSKLSEAVSILSSNRIIGTDPFNSKNKFNFFDTKGVLLETKGAYFPYKTDYTPQEIIRVLNLNMRPISKTEYFSPT
jgi:hypothetical protein